MGQSPVPRLTNMGPNKRMARESEMKQSFERHQRGIRTREPYDVLHAECVDLDPNLV